MGEHSHEPLQSLSVRKSNDFISAKYKSTLLENQVMAIALTRIEINAKDIYYPLEARLYPSELKKLVSDPTHIYRDLKKLSKTITGHNMFIEDGRGNFKSFAIVTNADYIDGVFILKFNKEIREQVLGLEKNYTNFELSMMTGFKKNSSFRLYEVLKKEAYKIPKGEGQYVEVAYNISELRFIIGLANSDDQGIKNAMANMGDYVDWDALYDKLDKKDKKYEEWRDFQRRIIKPAQEELQEKSDIRFEYEGIRDGRKTRLILFRIFHNIPTNTIIIDEKKTLLDENSNRQLEMPMDMYPNLYKDFIGHNSLSKEDIDLFLNKSNYNEKLVRDIINYADEQPYLSNYIGWIIKCIEDPNHYGKVETIEGNADRAAQLNEILDDYHNNQSSIANRVWEKIKTKDEFPAFIQFIGIDLMKLEMIYDSEELTEMFTDWKIGKL